MTGDEFTARYRLREQLGEGDVVSFRATDGRGSAVLVHVIRGDSVEPFDPGALDATGQAELREVLEVEGLPVVVTEPVDGFTTFEAWRESREGGAEPPGAFTRIFKVLQEPGAPTRAPGPPTPPSPPSAPGSEPPVPAPSPTPAEPSAGAPPAGSPEPAAGEPSPPAPEPPPDEPGEFTRRFGALHTPADAAPPPPRAPASPPDEPAPRPEPPTRPVRPPVADPSSPGQPAAPQAFEALRPPDPPTPAETEATGVFTRIMSARPAPPPGPGTSRAGEPPPGPPARPPEGRRPAPPPPAPPPPPPPAEHPPGAPGAGAPREGRGGLDSDQPGPFTLAMRGHRQPQPPPSLEPADYQVSDDYLSRLQGPTAPGTSGQAGPRPPDAPPPAPGPPGSGTGPPGSRGGSPNVPPPPSGPSEYTRVIRGGGFGGGRPPADPMGSRGAPPPAPAPPPPAPQPSGGSKTGVWIGLVVVLALIAAVLGYFVLRPPSG